MNRRMVLGGLGALTALTGALWGLSRQESSDVPPGGKPCEDLPKLTRSDLDAAISLGGRYLTTSQKPEGDFIYEIDWTSGVENRGNNVVRQAGAVWGLAVWHRDGSSAATEPLDRALAFWRANRRSDEAGRSWLSYKQDTRGQMGTIALIGLALVDRLSTPHGLEADRLADWTSWLSEIIAYAVSARLQDGGFADSYHIETGALGTSANPYVDGELLLLLVKAGLQLGLPDCVARAREWAPVDHARNVERALQAEPDSDTTKGYYQWGSMSWHLLASAGHDAQMFGSWLVSLATWMIDVHHTLSRTKNTAYAYEGILSAYDWATRSGDAANAERFACVAHQGMRKLLSWQLGHPLARDLAAASERYHGGVQNSSEDPILRIDVTQHQLHACVLAKRFGLA